MKQLKHAEQKTYTSKEIKKYSRVPEKRHTQIAGEHGSHIISFLLLEGFSAIFFRMFRVNVTSELLLLHMNN